MKTTKFDKEFSILIYINMICHKPSILLVIGLLFPFLLSAQRVLEGNSAEEHVSGADMVRYKTGNYLPNYVQFRMSHQPAAEDAILVLEKILQINADYKLVLQRSETDILGWSHQVYTQIYKNVPVEYGGYKVHISNGRVVSVNGEYYGNISISTTAAISSQSAIQAAVQHVGAQEYQWQSEEAEAMLKMETGDPSATFYPVPLLTIVSENGNYDQPKFRLAWKVDIYATRPLSRNHIYIDAQTGAVIHKTEEIHTADVNGTAATGYSGNRNIVCDSFNGGYRLREAGRGNGIRTFNMATSTNYTNTDFTSSTTTFNLANPQKDQYATDAHWGAEMTYDYFFQVHNRNSIDGNGHQLLSYVHYSSNYDNAFWDGSRMTYGDGGSFFTNPLTTLDIAGHEITHGLTEKSADLVYAYESGALNESFSDIFGVAIDQWARGTSGANLWRMGDECTGGNGIRRMDNPGAFGDPDTYGTGNWYTGTGDNGGVHTNSGVQNFWFYLLVSGGTGTNDYGNAYNVTGQGFLKATSISFRNLTVYLSPNSNYSDARFYSILAAQDLYGACSPEVVATANAWYAVGVGNQYSSTVDADFNAPVTSFCVAPATVYFNNTSSNASTFLWHFGDGNTSTQLNPVHTYQNYGTYNVKLVVGGGCGSDSVVQNAYIVVDNNLPCNVNLSPSGQNSTQISCTGTLYDSGGPNANYGDNTNTAITIAPTGASTVTLTFSSFNFEDGYDFLYVYDGPSINSPLIGQYTGSALPNGGTITSTGGAITVRQFSDPYVVGSGFALTWNCHLPNQPPVPDFYASVTSSCDGVIHFVDQTTNGAISWLWDFGDGNTSTQQSPTHTYQNDGVYTVKLVATNGIGSDSIIFNNYVTVDRPNAPAVIDAYLCNSGSVMLQASGLGTLNWFTSLISTTPINSGTTYSTPVLNNTTTYYVENEEFSSPVFVGPLNGSIGAGGNHNNTSIQYLVFDVMQNCVLNSVWVNATGAGYRTINLWDNSGNLLDNRYVYVNAGMGRIALNFDLEPGTGYRIGGSEMGLYRNNSGVSYPYTANPNLVSITNSSAGTGFYYYFYDWEVVGVCKSPRVPVTAYIGPAAASFTSSANGNTVTFTSTSVNANSYSWNFGDGNTSTQQHPVHTYSGPGNYMVTLVVNNGSCSDTYTREVEIYGVGVEENAFFESAVFPNPFSAYTQIRINGTQARDYQVSVYNPLGEKIADIHSGMLPAGQHLLTWTPSYDIAAGIYLVKVASGNAVQTFRVLRF